jgi:peroxiredoxin
MIAVGGRAPDFTLQDQFSRRIGLDRFSGRRHVMLLFYALDFTPTCSTEVPGLEAARDRLRAANTQVLGVSVDSIYCHANWAMSLGGISFPLLSDFHPKGEMAASYGLYLEQKGITDRATVVIDADGIVRHASSVTPDGKRDIGELATICEEVNDAHENTLETLPPAPGLEEDTTLFIRSNCMSSANAMAALTNLHIDSIPVHNVSENEGALYDLIAIAGTGKAPCLVVGGRPRHETAEITAYLAGRVTRIGR